jgi:hypothetical protein
MTRETGILIEILSIDIELRKKDFKWKVMYTHINTIQARVNAISLYTYSI